MDKRLDTQLHRLTANAPNEGGDLWRPIHYLGSKLRILEPLKAAIAEVGNADRGVCDLFAGSGTVSSALSQDYKVTAADIQEYSRVLCSAVLLPTHLDSSVLAEVFGADYDVHLQRLLDAAEPLIAYEDRCLFEARHGQAEGVCDLIEHASIVTSDYMRDPEGYQSQETVALRLRKVSHQGTKSTLFRHFGGLYFSYRQAAHLDAMINAAHAQMSPLKETLLAISISIASEVVNTVGKQFAQPIQPRDANGLPKKHLIAKIVRDRELDIASCAAKWVQRYSSIMPTPFNHQVLRSDFATTLREIKGSVGVVYADPPYTREHYSRFYHVLETMCLADEPSLSTTRIRSLAPRISRGVYRNERHQSPFCIRSKAPEAFKVLFQGVKDADAGLVLSYSPFSSSGAAHPRVMTIEQITTLAESYFAHVNVTSAGRLSHSKLNSSKHHLDAADEAELIITCS